MMLLNGCEEHVIFDLHRIDRYSDANGQSRRVIFGRSMLQRLRQGLLLIYSHEARISGSFAVT